MPIENNPRKIPQLTSIPTPTAGQELDIETVVAKESTYANFKMTLAQIFTLATISGSIKTVTDNLASLISGNTTSINTLTSTKLNTAGGTRTGLTPNRAIITDSSGVETYLTGTNTQVIGFDGSGKPTAVTPTVDIAGLTEKTAPVGGDFLSISDSEASGANKKVKLGMVYNKPIGNGSDGNVTISTTITLTRDMQYGNLTVTGSGIINTAGYTIYYSGTAVIDGIIRDIGTAGTAGTAGAVGVHGGGGAGGAGSGKFGKSGGTGGGGGAWGGTGGPGITPTTSTYGITDIAGNGGSGASSPNGGGGGAGGSGSNTINRIKPIKSLETILYPFVANLLGDAGGGGGGGGVGSSTIGAGGGGGGGSNGGYVGLYGKGAPTGTGTISTQGGAGGAGGNSSLANANGAGGGGGGGSGGVIDIPYGTTLATNVLGGTGGTGGTGQSGFNGVAGASGSNGIIIFN